MSISARLYRLMLKAYPSSYRREYASPMAQHFNDQLRAASNANRLFRLWCRTITDLVRTAPLRHLERWLPCHGNFRFTDDARLAIFFARYEASSFSRTKITLEHLLLGLIRSDSVFQSTLGQKGVEHVVRRIELSEATARKIPASEDLPLSQECKQAANHAINAAALGHQRVTTRHLITAILAQETTLAARILRECGIDRWDLR
jgi:hypothetical protein